jgi:hypothetical protein
MDTQIGLLGEKYSLALDNGSAFNSYNLMLTNLLLYLTNNVISNDFFIYFDTSFSPSAKLKLSREKSVYREKSVSVLSPFVFREISPLTCISHWSIPLEVAVNMASFNIDVANALTLHMNLLRTCINRMYGMVIGKMQSVLFVCAYNLRYMRNCHMVYVRLACVCMHYCMCDCSIIYQKRC